MSASSVVRPLVAPDWKRQSPEVTGRAVYLDPRLNRDTLVYRYMKAARFYSMLKTSTLWLTSPSNWDDPYEEWWCRKVFDPRGALAKADAFGSCWTLRCRDEPFWRLYADHCDVKDAVGNLLCPPEPAVRIRTTVGRLIDALCAAIQLNPAKAFVGRVAYGLGRELRAHAKATRKTADEHVSSVAASALHFKRTAYRFEREVRVLWIDRAGRRDHHTVTVDVPALVDQVRIGPAKQLHHVEEIESRLADAKWPAAKTTRSIIYNKPR